MDGIDDIDDGTVEADCTEPSPWETNDQWVVAADAKGGDAGEVRVRGLRSE